MSKEVKSTEKS